MSMDRHTRRVLIEEKGRDSVQELRRWRYGRVKPGMIR